MDHVASHRLLIQQNGYALSKTYGKSMRPLIWGGQHCVAVTPLEGEPAVGDLLMFMLPRPNGQPIRVVHRLVEIRQVGGQRIYLTRGDNCLGCESVSRSDIIGRVAEVHRTSGFRPWHAICRRQFAVTDPAYIRYTRLWTAIWPARRLYYRLRSHAYALYTRLLSKYSNTNR